MDLVHGCMQSYPYQRGQVPCTAYYPNTDAVPTQTYADPAHFPVNYGCCPWGITYGYSYPVHGHGCCNPNHFAAHYAWRPTYSHFPTAYHHPPFQSSHPTPYPVPDYSIGLPRYEYEKNMSNDHHCCGCPNHPCNKKEENNVRIEEEVPNRESKSNECLVPVQSKNYRYPIVWFPPDYMNSKEHKKLSDSEHKDRKDSNDNSKITDQKPTVWDGWFPQYVANLGSIKQKREDPERNQNQQDAANGHFPFPIFWMPYKPEEMETKESKVDNVGSEPSQETVKNNAGETFKVDQEHTNSNMPKRTKDIPVKQVEQLNEEDNSGNCKAKESDNSVKKESNDSVKNVHNVDKRKSEGISKRKSPSPPKASKLPPVCLRVDPLPRRKNTNGSSRSPSPPSDQGKLNQSSDKANRVHNSTETVKPTSTNDNEYEKETTNKKTIGVTQRKTEKGGRVDVNAETSMTLPVTCGKDSAANQADERSRSQDKKHSGECKEADKADVSGETGSRIEKNKELSGGEDVIFGAVKDPRRKDLSDSEAATAIQSAYRGFAVRKWEPLKKLKQIAKVREQIAGIRHQIQEMELSSDIPRDSKLIHMIGETIMSMLLNLDTIQGLHPSIRDIRKSATRELVSLQERLDSLINKKPEAPLALESSSRGDEGADAVHEEIKDDASVQGVQGAENTSAESILLEDTHVVESCRNQLERGSQSESVEISESMLVEEQPGESMDNRSTEILWNYGVEQTGAGPKPEDIQGYEQNYDVQETDELSTSVPLVKSGHEMTDSSTIDGATSPVELTELPCGVLDDDMDVQGGIVEQSTSVPVVKSGHGKTDSSTIDGATSLVGLTELPCGVLDDDIDVQGGIEHGQQTKEMEYVLIPDTQQEGSKASSGSTALEDKVRNDHNREDIELNEKLVAKPNDILVHAEGEEMSPDESVKIHEADDNNGSKEVLEDKPGDARAEPAEDTSQPPLNIIPKIGVPKEEDDLIGPVDFLEDKLGDVIVESDECSSQPPDNTGGNVLKSAENKIESVEMANDNLARAAVESDDCTSRQPQADINEHNGADNKIEPVELVDDELGNVTAESDEHTCLPLQDAKEKISESVVAPVESKLQMEKAQELEPSGGNEVIATCHHSSIDSEQYAPDTRAFLPAEATEVVQNEPVLPASPTASQRSHDSDDMTDGNKKFMEENEKLREMMEKLIKAGQEQLTTISSLSGRVKDLEKKLSRKKKLKTRRFRVISSGSMCKKPSHDHLNDRTTGVAM